MNNIENDFFSESNDIVPVAFCEVVDYDHDDSNVIAEQSSYGDMDADVLVAYPIIDDDRNNNDFNQMALTEKNGGRMNEHMNSYLFDWIRSFSHHDTSEIFSWSEVVTHILRFPEQVRYIDEISGRSSLHMACLSWSRIAKNNEDPSFKFFSILMKIFPMATILPDASGNLPIHLLFCGGNSNNNNSDDSHSSSELLDVVELMLTKYKDAQTKQGPPTLSFSGSIVSRRNRQGSTALDLACDNKNISAEIIQSLVIDTSLHLKRDCCDTRDASCLYSLNTNFGESVLMDSPLSRYAVAGGTNISVIRLLMDAFPDSICQKRSNKDNESILHRPAFYGNVNFVESVMLHTTTFDESRSETFWDIEKDLMDKRRRTPLHRACQGVVSIDVINLLLDNFPSIALIKDSPHERTPLHYLCLHNKKLSLEPVLSLLNVSPELCRMSDRLGYTPLHYACSNSINNCNDMDSIVHILLQYYPEATRTLTQKGDTPLHLALEHYQQRPVSDRDTNISNTIVAFLMDISPEVIEWRNNYGFTPLHCACRAYQPLLVAFQTLLLYSNVYDLPQILIQRSNNGDLPLHMAANNPRTDLPVLRLLLEVYEKNCIKIKKELSYDEFLNKLGNNPLHTASCQNHSAEFIITLASFYPNWISQVNDAGYTPLHLCCKSGVKDIRIFQCMLDFASKNKNSSNNILTITDEVGHAPLHSACNFCQSSELVSFMTKECPDVVALPTICGGDLPLHLAYARKAPFPAIKTLIDIMVSVSINYSYLAENPDSKSMESLLLQHRNHEGSMALDILMSNYKSFVKRVTNINQNDFYNDQYNQERAQLYSELLYLMNKMVLCERIQNRIVKEFNSDSKAKNTIHYFHREGKSSNDETEYLQSDLHVCLWLWKKFGSDIIPSFIIQEVLSVNMDQASKKDSFDGCYPLHLACDSNASDKDDSGFKEIVEQLLTRYPQATSKRNYNGDFPLDCLLKRGRTWIHGCVNQILVSYPPAINLWQRGGKSSIEKTKNSLDEVTKSRNKEILIPFMLQRIARDTDLKTLFHIIQNNPHLCKQRYNDIS